MNGSVSISIKKNQVIIRIDENADQKAVIADLKKKILELKNLYKDDKTPILITGKILKNREMEEIQNLIKRFIDVQVEFDSPKVLGLHGIKKTFYKEVATSETKFHKGSLRSGQRIEFEGSIVIIGDVNAGAEVVAGENIIVLGTLRGLAHAGAKGNKDAVIEGRLGKIFLLQHLFPAPFEIFFLSVKQINRRNPFFKAAFEHDKFHALPRY